MRNVAFTYPALVIMWNSEALNGSRFMRRGAFVVTNYIVARRKARASHRSAIDATEAIDAIIGERRSRLLKMFR